MILVGNSLINQEATILIKIKKSSKQADNIRSLITKKVRNLLNVIQINLISN